MNPTKSTLFGILAICIWGTFTALIRSVTESFGVTFGAALIYSVASLILLISQGIPKLRSFPIRYLVFGGLFFICYEIFLSLSIGMAKTRYQSIEISLINYLWPTLIVLFSIWINHVRLSLIVIPGILLAFIGVIWSLSGGKGINLSLFIENFQNNPISYTLVFIAAILWGLYCNIAKRYGNGVNGVPLFFCGVTISLWIKFFISDDSILIPPLSSIIEMLIAGVLIGASYSFWEIGIQKGNMILLAVLSYFTPILSILFSGFWLDSMPTSSFWYGVIMVTFGSFLCFLATKPNFRSQKRN